MVKTADSVDMNWETEKGETKITMDTRNLQANQRYLKEGEWNDQQIPEFKDWKCIKMGKQW
jgi:hypothetical protein